MARLTAALICITCLFAAGGALATLRTFVEPRLVDEMDTIRLTIRKEGSNQSEAPDLNPLMKDFDVLGSQTSSRISSINGRTMASVEYQISLRPQRTGELTIPSLDIGGEQSEAIVVRVRALDPSVKEAIARMVFFETELDRNPVYVQAETVLTRRLFYSQGVQIYSDLPGVPKIENAVVIPLGETQSRSVLRDDRRYGVIEQRFALFPEESGSLTIPAISVTSSVRLQSQGRSRRSGIRVSTEEIILEVLPIPAGYPADAPWLPARNVSVRQQWSPSLSSVDVGEPLTFEVAVRVEGNRGSAIPPIPLPLPPDQFKIYPEAPGMEEVADSGTVAGTRTERFALIPTAPGRLSVPELSITWWDTEADRLRQTAVPITPLEITGEPTTEVPAPARSAEPQPAAEPAPRATSSPRTPLWGPMIIGAAVVMTLVSLLLWLARRYAPQLDTALARFPILDRRPARTRRQLTRAMIDAAGQSDPRRYRQALVEYLCHLYGLQPSQAMERFRRNPEADRLLDALERAGYAPAGERSGAPDLRLLTALARAESRRLAEARAQAVLPGLYG